MKTYITFCLILLCLTGFGQDELYEEIKSNEIHIPSSPAFSLLGVNPEMVMRPSDVKSFKVDWRIKNYNLAPDLALEAQPLWQFFYKKKNYREYSRLSPFERALSSLSVSLGTAKIDGVNHMAYSVKVNVYAENDLLKDNKFLKAHNRKLRKRNRKILERIDSLQIQKSQIEDTADLKFITEALELLKQERQLLWETADESFFQAIQEYNAENWNRSMIDVAFGRVYTYNNTAFDSLKFQKAGFGFWINGCLRSGKNGLITGIVRFSNVGGNSNQMFGLSYTYGSDKFNFYIEGVYQRLSNFFDNSMEDPFADGEGFGDLYSEDLGSGWLQFNTPNKKSIYTLAYGGNFKISRNILLNFALRTELSNKMKLTKLIPVANVVCLMN